MNDKTALAPDEIHQIAFEEGQPADNGDGYLFTAEEFDLFVQRLLDSAIAEPVPPAGGEVLGYARVQSLKMLKDRGYCQILLEPTSYGDYVELIDRAHVTRLQAELTSANADKAAYAQNAIDLRAEVELLRAQAVNDTEANTAIRAERDHYKSELTKARDYAADLEACEPVVGISDETGFKRVYSDWCERCDAVTQYETRCTGCRDSLSLKPRTPICCGSCPGGCTLQANQKGE